MTRGKKAGKHENTAQEADVIYPPAKRPEAKLPHSTARVMRRISPLGFRVVVKIRSVDNVTDTGLYLPEGAKAAGEESLLAEVIEVASAADNQTDEETNISGVPLNAIVLIPKSAGIKVSWDDSLRIVDTKDVLGIVHEMRLV